MKIDTNPSLYELKQHGSPRFPFQIYIVDYEGYSIANAHWHQELELQYLIHGELELCINGSNYSIKQGEGILINSNALHEIRTENRIEGARSAGILIYPGFIAPVNSSIFYEDVYPFVSNSAFSAFKFTDAAGWQQEALSLMRELIGWNAHGRRPKLRAHILVCLIWELLLKHNEQIPSAHEERKAFTSRERTRQMLKFIYDHYAEPLSVQDIADSAGVSRSECFRCFQKMIGKNPFRVLNEYRLEAAARLLQDTEFPVSEVGLRCGFNSQSYFGKKFREYYHKTPLEFRTAGKKIRAEERRR